MIIPSIKYSLILIGYTGILLSSCFAAIKGLYLLITGEIEFHFIGWMFILACIVFSAGAVKYSFPKIIKYV